MGMPEYAGFQGVKTRKAAKNTPFEFHTNKMQRKSS